jgi:CRAL/TRIO, N-terminal domain/CRAL/TRIO domain
MAAQSLPGRPGNLTIDQEVKLQDLWKATLKTFGVPEGEVRGMSTTINGTLENEPDEDAEEEEDTKADPNAKGKDKDKKKKKRNIFGRKKKDKDEKETKSTEKAAEKSPTAADDKYGQTKEYLEALEKNKAEDLRSAFWRMVKADHPDGLLLRFLRARKWDIEKALVMMISTLNWRLNDMKVDDDIMPNGEGLAHTQVESSDAATKKIGDDFLAQLRLGKSFLHGTDKEGRPMCIVRTRLHKQGEQAEPSLERFTVYTIETARLMLVPPTDTAVRKTTESLALLTLLDDCLRHDRL